MQVYSFIHVDHLYSTSSKKLLSISYYFKYHTFYVFFYWKLVPHMQVAIYP